MPKLPPLPKDSLLGINYSGMHDSAIALTDREGNLLFASSLERLSRVKQDGRPPYELIKEIDWSKIAGIAISTNEKLPSQEPHASKIHPTPLGQNSTLYHPHHSPEFYAFFDALPAPKHYFSHHLSHLASSYYISGFQSATGLVYDAGTYNDYTFGGLFDCSGIKLKTLDLFNLNTESKFTLLYAFVTAILGFSPNKHEGKITGLAAYGQPTQRCRDFLNKLLTTDYFTVTGSFEWVNRYSKDTPPSFIAYQHHKDAVAEELKSFKREELAATVQTMAEEHIISILNNAKKQGFIRHPNICLSGGLFANVKINQRVKEWGFENVFVAPPMTDDGTALGAALLLAAEKGGLKAPTRIQDMFLGIASTPEEAKQALKEFEVAYTRPENPAEEIAMALHSGLSVAVVQGRCEFGPRALGNRSVLASAQDPDINQQLNKKFHRTEFMPFAPMTMWEDAEACYKNIKGAKHTAEFMTMTFDCTPEMKKLCPAVVHIDGTARPQLVRKEAHPLIYQIITHYKKLSGRPAIINTSYNMHEEPIVGTATDAIKAFLESGIDLLFIEGYLIRRDQNWRAAAQYLQTQVAAPTQKEERYKTLSQVFEERWHKAVTPGVTSDGAAHVPINSPNPYKRRVWSLKRKILILKILLAAALALLFLAFFTIK